MDQIHSGDAPLLFAQLTFCRITVIPEREIDKDTDRESFDKLEKKWRREFKTFL
jgi:hypothetical protein